ncbi:MAG: SMP-30/gluconolactonase/LRE family protein [Chthoniobacter sp.]|uniref:SMP-30/gluconolactonase/LRE family protein n=1 Tax=Chthoniobacter sp. TaxID=2510640 RepID=UPI0032A91827
MKLQLFLLAALGVLLGRPVVAQTSEARLGRPVAIVDLATRDGTQLAHAQWRYHDVQIHEVAHHDVGADLKATGAANLTYDYEPHAGPADFDDANWEIIAPESLDQRRGHGRLSFNWYRINVTIPAKIGAFDPTGATIVFEVVVDDYAEVWVDGQLGFTYGQSGGQVVRGWNAPNRVVLTRDARPGQKFQLAVFGMNGPISASPANFIWVKSATLDFHRPPAPLFVETNIERLDPALDAIVPRDAKLEKVATGFTFTEGPVWSRELGALLFSDPNENTIYRLTPEGEVSVFRSKSGSTGAEIGEYGQPGSNGLTFDRDGRLTIDQHGNRRVVRIAKNGVLTVLADRFDGKRLNSPNDLVYRRDGTLFFTDPPFGLPKFGADPRKELLFSGVFAVKDGRISLVTKELSGPNGIAFSPDEKFLYVGDWDDNKKVVMRYCLGDDGAVTESKVFADFTAEGTENAIDGLKVDTAGNVYISGPRGLWIVSPEGKRLGLISGPEQPHNFAWGDGDGRTLYLCAHTSIYRLRLATEGVRP